MVSSDGYGVWPQGWPFATQLFAADPVRDQASARCTLIRGATPRFRCGGSARSTLWADLKCRRRRLREGSSKRKFPSKLVPYDDQSNTATASTLYNQLITTGQASSSWSPIRFV